MRVDTAFIADIYPKTEKATLSQRGLYLCQQLEAFRRRERAASRRAGAFCRNPERSAAESKEPHTLSRAVQSALRGLTWGALRAWPWAQSKRGACSRNPEAFCARDL